ncbi:protein SOK2 [Sporothrix schenckii 1099-18]|uniref:Protein SOK2 n=1 Tax=Sporothrix schenckii 1099-18 TaxID=1397361 RepID=A0A0F2MKV8_SPOSC|nr:protein SOK2 [Sporothrix schenckii 1099-18]KJR88826.1 protein SOK2 [Sporothrix schenckii 1099-18]
MNERLPSLPFPPSAQQAYSSGTASPRVGSIGSSTSSNVDSQSPYTSVASSHGPKTPPSSTDLPSVPSSLLPSGLHTPIVQSSVHGYGQYQHAAMNQGTAEMYYQQPHLQGGQAQPPPVTSSAIAQYTHQQPPLLQPGPAQYPNPSPYGQYGYTNGLTSPPTAAPVANPMTANPHVLPLPGVAAQQGMQNSYSGFDNTGQIAPPGMKPRVTATLWEDEGSLCFQVEARGICVARREDNHMINGTKLLNVAGMTRGRRDGILKSEKVRHVVKIGPMHLKGVWIPFERALDFANKEKITELLFPLFVHNIAALLYHPTNQTRTSQVMAAAERRKQEQGQMRNGQPGAPGLPSLQHHSTMALPGPQQTLPSHANMTTPTGRPPLDRAHTFPTPPTSASSVMGSGMSASEPFSWPQQGVNGAQAANPMSIDTSLSNARSMPATPATTPPGPHLQAMQQYPPTTQTYDASRSMYHHQTPAPATQQPPSQQHTPHHNQQQQSQAYPGAAPNSSPHDRNNIYGHNAVAAAAAAAAGGYVKAEMPAPVNNRSSIAGPSGNEPVVDNKSQANGLLQHAHNGHAGDGVSHSGVPEDEHEHEHETEYTHDSNTYDASRAQYNYGAPQVATLPSEHTHLSTDVAAAAAANHQATSGRSTPRSAVSQAYYAQQGYSTPPRTGATSAATQASSNLYNVVTSDRGNANGAPTQDVYAGPADLPGTMPNGYTTPTLNGTSAGMKRGRDDDDDRSSLDMKRRKTLLDSSMPSAVYDASAINRAAPPVGAPRHR